MSLFSQSALPIELRDYQLAAIEAIRECIRQGKKNILLCAPTGSGKTLMAAFLVFESKRKGRRSAFVVDMNALIRQTEETFETYGIDHGVIQGEHERRKPWELVQICSAQTIQARNHWPDNLDLIFIDEAHVMRKVVLDRISTRETITVGLTATPFTKGLGKLYDALVNVTTTNKLIEQGFLAPYRIFAASEPNMEGVKIVAGEWVDKEASKRALEVVGDVVKEYKEHGEGRKFICSACDTAHVEELARQFNAAGIRAVAYTYKVDDDERAQIVREFRKPESIIRGLITVTAASKGFDVPDIGCVIMARPLRKSLAEHIQFFGRGLRIHRSKENCIVLDHSGNSVRFWDDWNAFFETGCLELDDGKKKPKPKKKDENAEDRFIKCQQCKHVHRPLPKCPVCGHEHPRKRAVAHVDGSLKELIAGGNRRKLNAEIWPQFCGEARARKADPVQQRKWALAKYRDTTGGWPTTPFEATPSAPLTREVANLIRSSDIRYAKSRQAAARQQPPEAPA